MAERNKIEIKNLGKKYETDSVKKKLLFSRNINPDANITTKVEVPFDYPRDPNHTDVAEFTLQVHAELEEAINAHNDSDIDKSAIG